MEDVICICNSLTADDIVSSGVERIAEVFKFYEVKPRCGACALKIREILQNVPMSAERSAKSLT